MGEIGREREGNTNEMEFGGRTIETGTGQGRSGSSLNCTSYSTGKNLGLYKRIVRYWSDFSYKIRSYLFAIE